RDLDREGAEAVRLARAALAADRDDPTVLAYASMTLAHFARDYDTAVAAVDRAVALNPNSALAWNFGGWVKLYVGASDDALKWFGQATRLSPLDPLTFLADTGIARVLLLEGRDEEAVTWSKRAVQGAPNSSVPWVMLAATLGLTGPIAEATVALRRLR